MNHVLSALFLIGAVILAGCGSSGGSAPLGLDDGPGVISLSGNGVPIANGDTSPSSIDGTRFGTTVFDSNTAATSTSTFTLSNTGESDFTLSPAEVTFSGEHAADFRFGLSSARDVDEDGSIELPILFSPSAAGTRTATVRLAPGEGVAPFTFAVRGTGSFLAAPTLTGNGLPITPGDTTPRRADGTLFDTATLQVGPLADTQSFVLTNPSDTTITLDAIIFDQVGDSGTHPFLVTSPLPVSVAAGSSTTVVIGFQLTDSSTVGLAQADVRAAINPSAIGAFQWRVAVPITEPALSLEVVTDDSQSITLSAGDLVRLFGSIDARDGATGVESDDLTLRIRNTTDDQDVDIGPHTLVLTGADSSAFSIQGLDSATTVSAGGIHDTVLRFVPQMTGTAEADLTFGNLPNQRDLAVDVEGRADGLQGWRVVDTLGSSFDLIPDGTTTASRALGTDLGRFWTTVGDTISSSFLVVNDDTDTAFTVTDIVIDPVIGNGRFFSAELAGNGVLAPDSSATLTVSYFADAPSSNDQATIRLLTDRAFDPTYTFRVAAFAESGTLSIFADEQGEPIDGDTTPSVAEGTDFGRVRTGNPSDSFTYYLINASPETVSLASSDPLTLAPESTAFRIRQLPADQPLPPGAQTTFKIDYAPDSSTAVGVETATVTVTTAEGDELDFVISATHEEPFLSVSGTNGSVIENGDNSPVLSDGTSWLPQAAGTSAPHTFTIHNTGADTVTLATVSLATGSVFSVTDSPSILGPGDSGSLTIRFAPLTNTRSSDQVTITTNDGIEPPYSFFIDGDGFGGYPRLNEGSASGPEIAIDGSGAFAFGDVNIVRSVNDKSRSLVITNGGDGPLSFAANPVRIVGSDSDVFSVTVPAAFPAGLDPGESATLPLSVEPDGLETFTASLRLSFSSYTTVTVALSAHGSDGEMVVKDSFDNTDIPDGSTDVSAHPGRSFAAASGGQDQSNFLVVNEGDIPLLLGPDAGGDQRVELSGHATVSFTSEHVASTGITVRGINPSTFTTEVLAGDTLSISGDHDTNGQTTTISSVSVVDGLGQISVDPQLTSTLPPAALSIIGFDPVTGILHVASDRSAYAAGDEVALTDNRYGGTLDFTATAVGDDTITLSDNGSFDTLARTFTVASVDSGANQIVLASPTAWLDSVVVDHDRVRVSGQDFQITAYDPNTGTLTLDSTPPSATGIDATVTRVPQVSGGNAATITPIDTIMISQRDFAVSAFPGSPVAVEGVTTFTITYTPRSGTLTTQTVTVSLPNNDADTGDLDGPRYDFTIVGVRTSDDPGAISVSGGGFPVENGAATASTTNGTDFGAVAINGSGSTSETNTFTITNSGETTFTLSATEVQLSGPGAGDFTLGLSGSTELAPFSSMQLPIGFTPGTTGTRDATVTIDPGGVVDAFSFAIRGEGRFLEAPILRGNSLIITDGDSSPRSADGTLFDTATQQVGPLTGSAQFSLENPSTDPITVTAIDIAAVGSSVHPFTVETALPLSIGANKSRAITIGYELTDDIPVGLNEADVTATIDPAVDNTYTWRMGLPVEASVLVLEGIADNGDTTILDSDDTLMLEGVLDGTSTFSVGDSLTLRLRNVSPSDPVLVDGTSLAISGVDSPAFSLSPIASSTLAPGDSLTLTLTYTPQRAGTAQADLTLAATNGQDALALALEGEGDPLMDWRVEGGGLTIATGDTTPSDSDSTDLGRFWTTVGDSISSSFVIVNEDTDTAFTITNLSVEDSAAVGDFAISLEAGSLTLAAGGSSTVVVSYTSPTVVNDDRGTVQITTDRAFDAVYEFTVAADAESGTLSIFASDLLASGDPIQAADTPSVNSGTATGDVRTGITDTLSFTLVNASPNSVTLSDTAPLSLSGDTDSLAVFSILQAPSTSLDSGAESEFIVGFSPTADTPLGTETATATLLLANGESRTFSIQGTHIEPFLDVFGTDSSLIADGDTTPELGDGTLWLTLAAGSSQNHSFVLTNTGSDTLTFSAIAVDGTESFAVSDSPSSLAPGDTDSVVVTFHPLTSDLFTTTLTITANDPAEPSYEFALQGEGTGGYPRLNKGTGSGPEIAIDGSAQLDFGTVNIVEAIDDKSITIVITNDGDSRLSFQADPARLSGADSPSYEETPASDFPPGLDPGESTSLVVRALPTTTDTITASLDLRFSSYPTVGIALSAKGVDGEILVRDTQDSSEVMDDDTNTANNPGRTLEAAPGGEMQSRFSIINAGDTPLLLGTAAGGDRMITITGLPIETYTAFTVNTTHVNIRGISDTPTFAIDVQAGDSLTISGLHTTDGQTTTIDDVIFNGTEAQVFVSPSFAQTIKEVSVGIRALDRATDILTLGEDVSQFRAGDELSIDGTRYQLAFTVAAVGADTVSLTGTNAEFDQIARTFTVDSHSSGDITLSDPTSWLNDIALNQDTVLLNDEIHTIIAYTDDSDTLSVTPAPSSASNGDSVVVTFVPSGKDTTITPLDTVIVGQRDITVSDTPDSSVAIGSFTDFALRFTPRETAPDSQTVTVSIPTNDQNLGGPTDAVFDFTVEGMKLPAIIQ